MGHDVDFVVHIVYANDIIVYHRPVHHILWLRLLQFRQTSKPLQNQTESLTSHSLTEPNNIADELAASIPVINLSLLTSDNPQIHAKAVHQLGNACADWGFFMLKNHGIPENLMEEVMKKSREFHELPLEEKEELKVLSLPSDTAPASILKQKMFIIGEIFSREVGFEYSQKIKGVGRKLLEGVSESLGLESNFIIESSGFDHSGLQILVVNLYPPCPQPRLSLGMPPHSVHGFFTFLMHNGIGGLQVKHEGKWVNINPLPNCLLVNIGDQLEVVSNGRCASALHKAILNNTATRISLVVVNGPAEDREIGFALELLEKEKSLFIGKNPSHTLIRDMVSKDFIRLCLTALLAANTGRGKKAIHSPGYLNDYA